MKTSRLLGRTAMVARLVWRSISVLRSGLFIGGAMR